MTKHWLRSGVIYCDGSTIADCHVYPDCDHANWGDDCSAGCELVQHQTCWKLQWVNEQPIDETFNTAYPHPVVVTGWEYEPYPDGEVFINWEGESCSWGYVNVRA